jgi:hypothetical protein
VPLVLRTTSPAPTTTPFLQLYAQPSGLAQQTDLTTYFGVLQTDSNPLTSGSTTPTEASVGDYQASARITAPSAGLRVIFGVFADPSVGGAQAVSLPSLRLLVS